MRLNWQTKQCRWKPNETLRSHNKHSGTFLLLIVTVPESSLTVKFWQELWLKSMGDIRKCCVNTSVTSARGTVPSVSGWILIFLYFQMIVGGGELMTSQMMSASSPSLNSWGDGAFWKVSFSEKDIWNALQLYRYCKKWFFKSAFLSRIPVKAWEAMLHKILRNALRNKICKHT